jgi:hypothetical protein
MILSSSGPETAKIPGQSLPERLGATRNPRVIPQLPDPVPRRLHGGRVHPAGTGVMGEYVFIPGAATDSWYWHLLTAELRCRGHRVATPDLRSTAATWSLSPAPDNSQTDWRHTPPRTQHRCDQHRGVIEALSAPPCPCLSPAGRLLSGRRHTVVRIGQRWTPTSA